MTSAREDLSFNDDEEIEKIVRIAHAMREMGAKISSGEIEKAIRLYRTARMLTHYNYFPLSKVLLSVFAKRQEDVEKLEKVLRGSPYKRKIEEQKKEAPHEKRERKERRKTTERRRTEGYELTWKDMEKMSFKKLKRMKLDTIENFEKLNIYRKIEMLRNYYRTGNEAYLELLKDHIARASQKRKGSYESEEGRSLGNRYSFIERTIGKLAYNPELPWALSVLSREMGEEFTADVIKYLIMKGKRSLAEQIAYSMMNSARQKSERGRKIRSVQRKSRFDVRRTVYLTMRNNYPVPVYIGRIRKKEAVLLIDKSDSMRKHYGKAVALVASLYDTLKRIYLFDEDVKQISMKKWHSKLHLIEEIIAAGTSGYTNISRALRKVEAALKPGDNLIIVSDMEQTVADESYVHVINRLRRKNIKIFVYTTEKHVNELKEVLDAEVQAYL